MSQVRKGAYLVDVAAAGILVRLATSVVRNFEGGFDPQR